MNAINKTLVPVALLTLSISPAGSAMAAQTFANWTSLTEFSIGTVTATVAKSNPINASETMLKWLDSRDGEANYPGDWFTPTPDPDTNTLSSGGIDNVTCGSIGSIDVRITFSPSVSNPRFHFVNLDNGQVDFGAVSLSRVSGNPEFEVSGTVVNSTPSAASNTGCEDASGGNPSGACGTVELAGDFSSVTFTVIDTNTSTSAGDGFGWTVSFDPSVPPADVSVTPGDGALTVSFTPVSGESNYTATCKPADDGTPVTADVTSGSSIMVSGLTNGVSYSCSVAVTGYTGVADSASVSETPVAADVQYAEATPVPTLGFFAQWLVSMLLGGLGVFGIRRRKKS